MGYYVYVLTNKSNKVLYTGMTNDLERRLYEHKKKIVKGFTEKYNLNKLVFFEEFLTAKEVIENEKRIKGWIRVKKVNMIEERNPKWFDLSEEILHCVQDDKERE